ncbi:MAG TPA: DUF4105 domain-containing protein [Lacipirellulaceae bacterium]|nr:DUF4105 domain-containing protein [Lacipirellulaceae bacterium]
MRPKFGRSRFHCARNALALAFVVVTLAGCTSVDKRLAPTNFRDWTPEQAVLSTVEFKGDRAVVHNVRNCKYFANDVYMVDYYDKTIDLTKVRGVDYIVVPFDNMPAIAQCMLSFQIDGPDGQPQHLAVSVETRKERNETYNPLKGSFNDFELIYVVADERDVIQFRTVYNGEHVYLYHTTASPEASKELLVDVLTRVNQLAKAPEFYDTLTNNCTSNIVRHVNRIRPNRISVDYRTLLPGYSDQLAYEDGLIEHHGTFVETKEQAYVNPLAERYAGREDFSELIRRR